MPAVVMVSSLPVEAFMAAISETPSAFKSFKLVAIFLERVTGNEESENFLFSGQALMLVPVGNVGKLLMRRLRFFLLKDAEQSVLARLGIALRFLGAIDGRDR